MLKGGGETFFPICQSIASHPPKNPQPAHNGPKKILISQTCQGYERGTQYTIEFSHPSRDFYATHHLWAQCQIIHRESQPSRSRHEAHSQGVDFAGAYIARWAVFCTERLINLGWPKLSNPLTTPPPKKSMNRHPPKHEREPRASFPPSRTCSST